MLFRSQKGSTRPQRNADSGSRWSKENLNSRQNGIDNNSAQQCVSQQRYAARAQRCRLRNQLRRNDGASHREQQRTAMYVAAAVCSTQAGGFGSRKAIDPLEMWPATVRVAQRCAVQHAGVGDVGALAKAWGWRVQARLRGSWRRTSNRKGLEDTQPADRQPTSGCPSLLSLLLVPNLCMLTCLRVRARVCLCSCVYVPMRA